MLYFLLASATQDGNQGFEGKECIAFGLFVCLDRADLRGAKVQGVQFAQKPYASWTY